ncbi:RIB43A-like with coiled-coils protein 1 isoform X2 [Amia ocellicauda]|uniref:RIB43A-like with coiled-coils protein 1 isoform X2 n=1 Tax=Amia ocellicauda TaxID=2972642 RepID=UPI0034648A1B
MYKVDVLLDSGPEAAVARRRTAELQRQSRVFQPRTRTLGLDLPTLHTQTQEHRHREQAEQHRERSYDAVRSLQDALCERGQLEEEQRRAQLARELAEVWDTQRRSQTEPIPDLLDLDGPLYGPASMQRFEGEDPGEKERKRAQKEESKRALRRQIEERERLQGERRHSELQRDRQSLLLDQRAVLLSALEEECRRAERTALSDYLRAQAEERAERERMERAREEEDKLVEVWQQVTSDLLTEPAKAGLAGGGCVLPDRWKGMTPQQLSTIYREREEQRAERERLREEERQRAAQWDGLRMEGARWAEEEERRARERERESRAQLDRYNAQLAREQRAHQEYLQKELYTNQPSAHFFTQFNTTSR